MGSGVGGQLLLHTVGGKSKMTMGGTCGPSRVGCTEFDALICKTQASPRFHAKSWNSHKFAKDVAKNSCFLFYITPTVNIAQLVKQDRYEKMVNAAQSLVAGQAGKMLCIEVILGLHWGYIGYIKVTLG